MDAKVPEVGAPHSSASALAAESGSFQALRAFSLPSRVLRILGDPRFRLEGALLALFVDSDGTAWSIEEPGVLRHWTVENGREHSRAALSDLELLWSFAPEGKLLASAGDDWSLWDRVRGSVLYSVPQPSWVTALAFHPDGRTLATGHDDGRVRCWDAASGTLRREWQTHEEPISALAFSFDGSTLAAATELRDIHLWNVPYGMNVGILAGHTDRISTLAWHPDNRHLVSGGWDTSARLWDTATGEPLFLLNGHGDQVVAMAYAKNGRYLATADSDHVIWLWDPFRGRALRNFRGHAGEITILAFTPDSRRLLSGGTDGRIVLWDAFTGKNLFRASDSLMTTMRISLSPGGTQIASIMGGHGLNLWDLKKQPPSCETIPVSSEATAVAHSPDGKWLASGHARGAVQIWNRRNNRPLPPLQEHQTRVTALAFSSSRPVFASAGGVDGYVYLWSLKEPAPLLLIPEAAGRCAVEAIGFVPNSPWFLAAGVDWLKQGSHDGVIQLWDLQRLGPVARTDVGATALKLHPSGEYFAAALLDETVGIFQTRTLKLLHELPGHGALLAALAISPDGGWLATAGDDAQVRICRLPDGKLQETIELDAPIRDLVFSRDGSQLCAASSNGTLCFLDVKELRSLAGS